MTTEKLATVPEDWNKALAIVAHPDDLEYGAASAIARWTAQGKEVVYVMVTRGEAGIDSMHPDEVGPLRVQEEYDSAAVVGVSVVEFMGLKDGVVEYGMPLRKELSKIIRRHKPDVVITGNYESSWGSGRFNMADHRAVGLAVCDAARDADNRWIFPELIDEGYDKWSAKMVLVSGSPNATHAVDVTDYIDKGIESLQKHKVYIENLGTDFDPDTFLSFNAAAIGERFGTDYATAFELMNL